MIIPFGVEAYKHRSKPLSVQNLINCYLETAPPAAQTAAAVVSSYGVASFAEGTGLCRGGYVRNGVPYAVIGQTLVQISSIGAMTTLGTIGGSGPVTIVGDEINLMIVTNTVDYTYNGSVVSQITDPDYPGADGVIYLDGYYIVWSGGEYFVSANRDPTSWDALDFASAEKVPDDIVDGIEDHSELILFGRESGEIFYDSGDADLAISKAQSGDFEVGIYCQGATTKSDNGVFFLGNDGIGYRLNGYTPERFTTHAIEQAIEDAADKNFRMKSWKEGGHTFVSIGSTSFTFVYDVATQLFHQRQSYGYDYWRINTLLLCFNSWLSLDSLSGKVGKLSAQTFTEFGSILRCSATSPSVAEENKLIRHANLQLVFETGVGLPNGQGSDPKVLIRWSDSGGRLWSDWVERSLGAMGEFGQLVAINRVGQARNRVYEYAITDPVRRTLLQATVETY